MPLVVNCSSCGRQLRVPDSLLGRLVKCPSCGNTFTAESSEPVDLSPDPQEVAPTYGEYQELPPVSRPGVPKPRGAADEPAEYEDDYPDRPRRRRRRIYRDLEPHRGVLILVLGILSLVVCGLLGPVAWIMGNNDLREMDAGRMDREGYGLTQAGRICGMITTILMIASLVFALLFFMCMGLGAAVGGR